MFDRHLCVTIKGLVYAGRVLKTGKTTEPHKIPPPKQKGTVCDHVNPRRALHRGGGGITVVCVCVCVCGWLAVTTLYSCYTVHF